ncbi:MAG TPA: aspartate aminotransferase family protein, partial [Methylomirabilota bacterium]|nr:aspartate aminotransferase family protein [Methylomirabilota bacterium]
VASLFGMHFTAEPVTNYRGALAGDQALKKALFIGLLNEGVLLQTGCAGALGTMTGEAEIHTLVEAVRRVVARIR